MTRFQLDECLNKLVEGCAQEGLCQVFRFPANMKGLKDPEMLHQLLQKCNPLITTDFALLDEHLEFIYEYHPGIIMITMKVCYRRLLLKECKPFLESLKPNLANGIKFLGKILSYV